MVILGLDVSTSCVGVAVLNEACDLVDWRPVTFKPKEFWEKIDALEEQLRDVAQRHPKIDKLFVEEPLQRFVPGFSSASTICTLQRFNGVTCQLARTLWHVDPVYLSAATARKAAGVKVVKGTPAKQQVFEHMCNHDLLHVAWPLNKKNEPVPTCKDVVDAYVVAKAGIVLGL